MIPNKNFAAVMVVQSLTGYVSSHRVRYSVIMMMKGNDFYEWDSSIHKSLSEGSSPTKSQRNALSLYDFKDF